MTTRTIAIKVDPTQAQAGARVVKRDLNEMADLAKKAEQSTGRLGSAANDNFGRMAKSAGVATNAMNLLKAAALGVAAALSVGALKAYADEWSDLQSKVGAAVKSMEMAPALMQRMTDIANASYSPLSQTVDAYSRNVGVLRDLGISAQGAADFTESLNHALVITATRGERAASVQSALSKAMATGKLSGDGLETVLTNGGRVAEALAQQLGVAQGQLRGLASQGKITSEVIANALIGNLAALRDEAGNMSATLADAGVIWNNVFTEWVGRIDQAWGVTGTLAEKAIELAMAFRETADVVIRVGNIIGSLLGPAFEVLGSNIEMIGQVATVAGAALLGYFAGPALVAGIGAATTAIVTGLVPALGAVVGGIRAIGLAMMANPLGLLIGGLALAVTAAFTFRDEIKQSIGVDVVEVFRTGANWIIGAMVGAVKATMAAWEVLPGFMETLGQEAWNAFLSGFEGSAVSWTNPFTGEVYDLIKLDLTDFKYRIEKDAVDIGAVVSTAFKDAQGDYVTGMLDGLSNTLGELWGSAEGSGQAIADLADQIGGGGASTGAAGEGLAGATGKATKAAKDHKTALTEEQKAAQQLAGTLEQTLGGAIQSLFNGPITSLEDAMDRVLGQFAQLGNQNLGNAFKGLFGSAANDNGATGGQWGNGFWGSAIFDLPGAVEAGAQAGTSGGVLESFGSLFQGQGGHALSSGLGGLGIGYQAQDPMMGALGGALQGLPALMMGNPLPAIIGGIGGRVGGRVWIKPATNENTPSSKIRSAS